MITAEPLRSALTNSGAEDTSLALPSDDKLRSGQQRVLDQVLTIKRSKSKHGKSGTLPTRAVSPTSRKSHSFCLTFNSIGRILLTSISSPKVNNVILFSD